MLLKSKKHSDYKMNAIQSVCVYSASSTKIADCYFRAARELGELLGHHGIRLVNGAGNLGLMRACADACLEAGGQVTGVIPRFMVEQGWQHPGLTELIETEDMHTRKQTMARLSDVSLPCRADVARWKNCSKSLRGNNSDYI